MTAASSGTPRLTSVSRDDTGNGACETLFVTEVRILRSGNPGWRLASRPAPLGLLAGLVSWRGCPCRRAD